MTKATNKSKPPIFRDALGILHSNKNLARSVLQAFNDLDDVQIAQLKKTWTTLSPERRILFASKLRDLNEEEFEFDFRTIFYFLLTDEIDEVRLASVEGLYDDTHIRLIDPYVTMLREDPSTYVRAAVATALGNFMMLGELEEIPQRRRDQVYSALMGAIAFTPHNSVLYARLIESIGYVTNEETVRLIREAAASENETLRLSALSAIANSNDAMYQDIARANLHSDSVEIRLEAVRACGSIEAAEAIPELAKLISDPELDVRLSAIEALLEIGTDDAKAALRLASHSKDQDVASAAEDALDELDLLDNGLKL
jgi:hypothetical protein